MGRRPPRLRRHPLARHRGQIEGGNSVVEINVVDPILRKGYRFKGPATVHREGPVLERGRRFYARAERPRPGTGGRPSSSSEVERAAPVLSPAYDDGSAKDAVEARSLAMYGLQRTPPP